MAEITLRMTALGAEAEKCNGCGKQFQRGEQMTAVKNAEGDPMGFFCNDCIADWKEKGEKSRVFQS